MPVSLTCRTVPAFPVRQAGRLPHHNVSRPAQRSLALRPAWLLSRPWRPVPSECFNRGRYLPQPLRLLPAGATVAGRDSHPLGKGAFHGALSSSMLACSATRLGCARYASSVFPDSVLICRPNAPSGPDQSLHLKPLSPLDCMKILPVPDSRSPLTRSSDPCRPAIPTRTGKYEICGIKRRRKSSTRNRIYRLPDQKITLTPLPSQLCTPHFLVLPQRI